MASKPIPGVAVFTIAMANLNQREAIPVSFEQVIQTDEEKAPAGSRPTTTANLEVAMSAYPSG